MNNFDPFLLFFIVIIAALIAQAPKQRRILLAEQRFWKIVAREEKPLVILTIRGLIRKRPCYLYPYQGILFYTWTRPEELPEGTMLVPTTEAFS